MLRTEWVGMRIGNRGLKIEKGVEREIRTLYALRSALCQFSSAIICVNLRLITLIGFVFRILSAIEKILFVVVSRQTKKDVSAPSASLR